MEKVELTKVTATDEEGNKYKKTVTLIKKGNESDKYILSFGGWCRYYLKTILKLPKNKSLCIDTMGRNHKGIPDVTISSKDMNKIEKLIKTEIE